MSHKTATKTGCFIIDAENRLHCVSVIVLAAKEEQKILSVYCLLDVLPSVSVTPVM